MAEGRPKRRWRNLVLDREYQLVFTLALVLSAALFMTGLGYVVMREAETATKTGIQDVEGGGVLDPKLAEETVDNLIRRRQQLNLLLIGLGVTLTGGLFVYGIKMTHKVAGPLHKISLYCDAVTAGKLTRPGNLRRGDQLVDFYEQFRQAVEALRRREEADVATLRAVLAAAEADGLAERSPELAARLDDLRARLATKEASLG
jgi:hypothetical protein